MNHYANKNDISWNLFRSDWFIKFPRLPDEFYSAADCESDAIDEAVDYIERSHPDILFAVVLTEEEIRENLQENAAYLNDAELGGSHGYVLRDSNEIIVRRLKHRIGNNFEDDNK